MILTLDIGNTNMKTALFDGLEMKQYWRLATNRNRTSDEYGMSLMNLMNHSGIDRGQVQGIMMSSVVPQVNFTIEHMCRSYFGMEPMKIEPGVKTGINIKYENPRELGSDRIANAVAAYELYGGPCITIDFGTATSFGAISAKGEFLGGAICPGLRLAADALTERTAKLPRFELVKPENVIGRNTVSNMQAGIVYGYIGQINYIINRMKREMDVPDVKVIATGGMATLVAGESKVIDVMDGLLTLKGLCGVTFEGVPACEQWHVGLLAFLEHGIGALLHKVAIKDDASHALWRQKILEGVGIKVPGVSQTFDTSPFEKHHTQGVGNVLCLRLVRQYLGTRGEHGACNEVLGEGRAH